MAGYSFHGRMELKLSVILSYLNTVVRHKNEGIFGPIKPDYAYHHSKQSFKLWKAWILQQTRRDMTSQEVVRLKALNRMVSYTDHFNIILTSTTRTML